ncbi:unnamed protein product [Angiostrongylus costaricensis]|uniref:DDE_3 domain-containing protein n=1 Tax=Angiostrongylus costaricensis TaxID=334426 RepID=A0A0R3PM50_ANGCS|nr:unnamed protein product [Angiostrongylus costaricensis]
MPRFIESRSFEFPLTSNAQEKQIKLDKWVPHKFNSHQKNRHFEVSSALILLYKNDLFLDRIVTFDKKWILYDNPLSGWIADKLHSTSQSRKIAPKTVMVSARWSAAVLIQYNVLNPGEAIAAEKYFQQMDEMHRKLQQQQKALVNRNRPILLYDNALHHVAEAALQKLN